MLLSWLILPEDIQPIPGAKTPSNRGRKASTVITSSPYKKLLTESLRLAETRGRGLRGGRGRGRGRGIGRKQGNSANRQNQRVSTSSSSSESDAVLESDSEYDDNINSDKMPGSLDASCIFCEQLF